ncbi:MAG: hypothetical protein WKF54_08505 [Nocardioidaceae bacterium]
MKLERTTWDASVTIRAKQDEVTRLLELADEHGMLAHMETSTPSSGKTGYQITLTRKGTKTNLRKGIAALEALKELVERPAD